MKWIVREWIRQLKKVRAQMLKPRVREVKPKLLQGSPETEKLLTELREAHIEWKCAQQRLDYVRDVDEIDYAIFALEAAEKRYSMLLRQAKALNLRGAGVHGNPIHSTTRAIGG